LISNLDGGGDEKSGDHRTDSDRYGLHIRSCIMPEVGQGQATAENDERNDHGKGIIALHGISVGEIERELMTKVEKRKAGI
jgi:hypothetical protein